MIKRWVTWGGVSRLVKLLLILIVIYFSQTILQSKRPVIPLAGDLLLKGFSDRNLSNSTSAQPHPSRGAVGGGSGGSILLYPPLAFPNHQNRGQKGQNQQQNGQNPLFKWQNLGSKGQNLRGKVQNMVKNYIQKGQGQKV